MKKPANFTIVTPSTFDAWKAGKNTNGENCIVDSIHNDVNLYVRFEWLKNCCIKQFTKYGGLDLEYLTESATLKSLTRETRKHLAPIMGRGSWIDMNADRAARVFLAAEIFDTCVYAAGL